MKTEFLKANEEAVQLAADILKQGGIVAMPTETVYGIAANAYDGQAVKAIFEAKGRPQDNPLICHISDMAMLNDVVSSIPCDAYKLAEVFWPGPLTIIMPKNPKVSDVTCAGLDSVGVRMPSHPTAHRLIELCGFALAAPSANLSGKPSPTNASDVLADMNGRLPLILDGGECFAGVESTVVSLLEATPLLLRPGYVTKEDMEAVLGKQVDVSPAITEGIKDGEKVRSPGMKYKHYAPNADITILSGSFDRYCSFVNDHKGEGVFALCFEGEAEWIDVPSITYGSENDPSSQAHGLFTALRELDRRGAVKAYARCPKKDGVSLAVYNRLIRAAAFKVVEL